MIREAVVVVVTIVDHSILGRHHLGLPPTSSYSAAR